MMSVCIPVPGDMNTRRLRELGDLAGAYEVYVSTGG